MNRTSGSKIINDPIHGLMEFDEWIFKFIDTEHFQRLRNIKQLGAAYYIYPGASHNRFEHSLGTAYLAHKLMKRIKETQPEIRHNEKDLKCVTLAALYHDLGHGPFSHLFERFMERTRPEGWSHEETSIKMFEDLLEKNNGISDEFDLDDIDFIKALIIGNRKICTNRPLYLFDIVANKTNSIDVDKFDYLARDCYYLGIDTFDSSRLMNLSRVIGDQIMYYHKECFGIYQLFHTRYSLHRTAYNHRVCRAVDLMICDALVKADEVLNISKSVDKPDEFLRMDDAILNRIEFTKDSRLKESQDILKKLRTRKLYKFVDECSIPPNKKILAKEKITAKEIVKDQKKLKEYDVIVEQLKLNYAMDDKNPVDRVKFYDKNDNNFKLQRSQVNYLVPKQYEEINVRIFARDPTPEKIRLIKESFQKLLKDYDFEITT